MGHWLTCWLAHQRGLTASTELSTLRPQVLSEAMRTERNRPASKNRCDVEEVTAPSAVAAATRKREVADLPGAAEMAFLRELGSPKEANKTKTATPEKSGRCRRRPNGIDNQSRCSNTSTLDHDHYRLPAIRDV